MRIILGAAFEAYQRAQTDQQASKASKEGTTDYDEQKQKAKSCSFPNIAAKSWRLCLNKKRTTYFKIRSQFVSIQFYKFTPTSH